MKEFSIPVKITLDCCLSVKANNQDEAYEVADDTMYWAYQMAHQSNIRTYLS